MAVVFGLASYAGAVSGLHLTSVTYGESASTAEAMSEDGSIEQIDVYGKKKTIEAEGNVLQGGDITALTAGGTITANGASFKIEKVTIKESATGHKTCSISGSAAFTGGTTGSGN